MKTTLTSAVGGFMVPSLIVDEGTGEVIEWGEFQESYLNPLLAYVHERVETEFAENRERLVESLSDTRRVKAAEWARQNGFVTDMSSVPRGVRAVSRLQRIIRYNLVSETEAWVRNPNPLKQDPGFGRAGETRRR